MVGCQKCEVMSSDLDLTLGLKIEHINEPIPLPLLG